MDSNALHRLGMLVDNVGRDDMEKTIGLPTGDEGSRRLVFLQYHAHPLHDGIGEPSRLVLVDVERSQIALEEGFDPRAHGIPLPPTPLRRLRPNPDTGAEIAVRRREVQTAIARLCEAFWQRRDVLSHEERIAVGSLARALPLSVERGLGPHYRVAAEPFLRWLDARAAAFGLPAPRLS